MDEHTHSHSHGHEHNDSDGDTITINKTSLMKGTIAVLAILLVISVLTGGFGYGAETTGNVVAGDVVADNDAAPSPTGTNTDVVAAPDMKELIDDDHIKGDPNAPVTIVEFSDYECPYCARFYSQTLGQIESEYIDTGKVKLVFRDFPLSFHQKAQKAAEAAECAGEQGKYYEMHDKLFEEGVGAGEVAYKQYAIDIGLDTEAFNTCLDSGEMAEEVQKDFADGQKAGIRGTPGFIINGQTISGALPFSNFKQIIDAELAK